MPPFFRRSKDLLPVDRTLSHRRHALGSRRPVLQMQREKRPGYFVRMQRVKAQAYRVGNLKLALDQFPIHRSSIHRNQRPADLLEFEAVIVETELNAGFPGLFAEPVRLLGSASPVIHASSFGTP